VGLLVIHFVIKYIMIVGPGGVTFQSALGLLAFLIALILAPLALFVLRRRRPGAAGNPRYEGNKTAHNIFAAAGLAALIHVMMATSTWSIALKTVVLVWGLFTLGAYVWHKILRPRRAAVLTLASVDELAPGVHAYALEPADGAKLRPRRSGQFAYLRFLGSPSGPEEHPFTVASPADAAPRFVVRGSGDYTRSLPETPTGTEVRLEGPYGHFHPGDEPEGTPLMFLAGGIGITPFLSMTGDAELRRRYPMNLLWSIHDEQDAGAGDALERAVAAGELKMRTVVSGREGRVGLEDLQAMMDEAGLEDAASGLWFVCGPAGFTDGMTRLLRGMKVPRRRLVEERFSW